MTYERSTLVNSEKYIGLDVHQATISVAVMDSSGKFVMESILETKAATILEFFAGLRGTLAVTFEEGTWAAWLYDLLKPHVAKLVVCNPRKNALLKDGNKSDRIDARKLAELLRGNQLKPVYHGETGVRMLRELARSNLTIVKDLTRVMNRLKALYRSWAIPCAGRDVYYTRHRAAWLGKIREAGVRRRAEQLYQQLDMLQYLRQQARRELLAESQASHHRPTAADSLSGAGSIGSGGGPDPDPASFPHQATAMGLQRISFGDACQRRTLLRAGPTASLQETDLHPGSEPRSQPSSERSVQSGGHHGQCASRPVPGLLPGIAREGHQANHGTSHVGAQNRRYYTDALEERRKLRRGKTKTASRLSVSGEEPLSSPVIFSGGGRSVLETLGFEGEYP